MPTAMNRSAALLAIALACLPWVDAARAQDSPSDVVTRLGRLEQTVRDLTGQVQELQYRNQQLEQQVQHLQGQGAPAATAPMPSSPQRSSVSTSLPPPTATPYSPPGTTYSAAPAPAAQYQPQQTYQPQSTYQVRPYYQSSQPAPVDASAAPAAQSGHDAFNPALQPGAPGAPRPLGTSTTATEPPPPAPGMDRDGQAGAPLNLSTISAPESGAAGSTLLPPPPPANPSGTGAMQQEAALPPNATPRSEYDLAYGYIRQKNYPAAAQTFRDFLHKFPDDRLIPEAQYWLGESLFEDRNYHDAAEAFLAVSTKYGTSARAPDALLRLGESLAALGEKEAACASLGEVLRKYPHASLSVKQSVDRDQKRVHC